MGRTSRTPLILAGLLGALAVGLGAFGAHGLEGALEGAPDAAKRLSWWRTAVSYHLAHAVLLGVIGALAERHTSRALSVAWGSLVFGVFVFSGTLYAMSLGAPRWFGAITPIGGLALIVAWLALAWAALRRSSA